MAKRILVISQRYWPEHTKINDICEGLVNRGLRVDVLCGQPNYPSGRFYKGYSTLGVRNERHAGVRLSRTLEIRRDNGSAFRIMLNYLSFSVGSFFKILSLRKNRYDAVLVYQSSSVMEDNVGRRIAKRAHIPMITYAVNIWPQTIYQELDIQNSILRKMFFRISKRHYLSADRLITHSKEAAEYFTGTLHMHPNKVFVVPFGQDSRFDKEVRNLPVMEKFSGSFNLLMADEMLKRQDYKTLFEAGKMILNSGINDIRIIVTGSGKALAGLKKKADREGLHDLIYFEDISDAEDMPKYFYITSAFLSCTKIESINNLSFPEMFADYMSQGKPILAATGSLEKKMIREADCGLVCDPKDPEGLFDMIMKLYKSPLDNIRRMGENALKYHKEHFDRETNIDKIMDILFRSEDEIDDGFIINQNTHIIRTEDI